MSGNLCRCGAYANIVPAIQQAGGVHGMKPFAYARPGSVAEAVRDVAGDPTAVFLAGGTNLVDHLRLGVATPELLVDVRTLTSREITDTADGGLRIGAAVTNSELAADRRVRERLPVLAQALLAGASGQLRNMATTGGNPLQRTRCVYFQDVTTPCNKREPGSGCSAIGGYTRYHAVLGRLARPASPPTPPTWRSRSPPSTRRCRCSARTGERTVPFVELHRLPGDDPSRDTVLEHGELITAIDLPAAARGRQVGLPQGAGPGVLRVRAGLGGRRAGGHRRHGHATSASPSAASPTSRGGRPGPRRRCAAARPPRRATARPPRPSSPTPSPSRGSTAATASRSRCWPARSSPSCAT